MAFDVVTYIEKVAAIADRFLEDNSDTDRQALAAYTGEIVRVAAQVAADEGYKRGWDARQAELERRVNEIQAMLRPQS